MRRMRQFDDLSVNALFLSWGGVNPRDGMSPKLPLVSGFLLVEVERGSCVDERKEKREVSATLRERVSTVCVDKEKRKDASERVTLHLSEPQNLFASSSCGTGTRVG